MTEQEAISYIENYGWSTTRLGLGRTKELLEKLGDPQKKLKFIHVAGSNGKGSCCAMFDAILREAGYRCGLYTSPYIEDFCERIRLNGENIPGDILARITEQVMQLAESMEDHPSQFELVTAIAMQYFYEQQCDIVVLEVGMGGALDSTNAIDAPELACITNIGLEHTEYLGDTLEEIARTKAGIIKPGCSCVCYDGAAEVTEVIREVCTSLQVPLACVDFSRVRFLSGSLEGQKFLWSVAAGEAAFEEAASEPEGESAGGSIEYDLALIGKHQLHNAALVLTGLEMLKAKGWNITPEAVRQGLKHVKWPARLEVLSKEPVVILDGGHNPQCAEALTESLDLLLPGKKVVFLAGVLKDKDYEHIVERMLPYAQEFVCLTPVSDRALSAEAFAEYIKTQGMTATACKEIEAGIGTALKKAGPQGTVVIFGSLYLAGAVRKIFWHAYRKWLRKEKIKARDRLTQGERDAFSKMIAQKILASSAWQNAKTVMVYEAFKGEVSLEALKEPAAVSGKKLVYPRCLTKETMVAFYPEGSDCFEEGALGIREPVIERSKETNPSEIDLVICPGTVFDEQGNRIGMGAGYYDRFLKTCVRAKIVAAAFDVQCVKELRASSWDIPMEQVFTEKRVIDRGRN